MQTRKVCLCECIEFCVLGGTFFEQLLSVEFALVLMAGKGAGENVVASLWVRASLRRGRGLELPRGWRDSPGGRKIGCHQER